MKPTGTHRENTYTFHPERSPPARLQYSGYDWVGPATTAQLIYFKIVDFGMCHNYTAFFSFFAKH